MNVMTDLIALGIVALCGAIVLRRAWRRIAALRGARPDAACGSCAGCTAHRSSDRRGGCS